MTQTQIQLDAGADAVSVLSGLDGSAAERWLAKHEPADWPWAALLAAVRVQPSPAGAQRWAQRMQASLGRRVVALIEQLARQYQGRPTVDRVLTEANRPLRALAIAPAASSYQRFCARDIVEGLIAHGVEARPHIIENRPTAQYELLSRLVEFDPDVLICNGTGRGDYSGLPDELTVVSWDQDDVLAAGDRYAPRRGERDVLRVMVREWLDDALAAGVPADRAAHLNLGTNHTLYRPPATPVEPDYDLLFVGNIYPFHVYRRMIGFDALSVPVQRAMLHARDRLAEWVVTRRDDEPFIMPDSEAWLNGSFEATGAAMPTEALQRRRLARYFRYRIAHFVLRERFVRSLAGLGVRLGLFGRGWEQWPELAAYAHPPIENGPPLREVIHRSAINLHLHTWTVHHPRLYDTAAAGGFLLVGRVDEQLPLHTVFAVGEGGELDSFATIDELHGKIRRYLADGPARRAMSQRAADRASRDHTMQQRMNDLIRSLTPHVAEHR